MTPETPPVGPHDEWLTEELARLRAADQGGFPKLLLIKGLRDHTGLGLKEAKDIVDDYGRRNGLPAGGTPSRRFWWEWLAGMVALLGWLGYGFVQDLLHKESWKYSHELALCGLAALCVTVVFTGVALYRTLRKRQQPSR